MTFLQDPVLEFDGIIGDIYNSGSINTQEYLEDFRDGEYSTSTLYNHLLKEQNMEDSRFLQDVSTSATSGETSRHPSTSTNSNNDSEFDSISSGFQALNFCEDYATQSSVQQNEVLQPIFYDSPPMTSYSDQTSDQFPLLNPGNGLVYPEQNFLLLSPENLQLEDETINLFDELQFNTLQPDLTDSNDSSESLNFLANQGACGGAVNPPYQDAFESFLYPSNQNSPESLLYPVYQDAPDMSFNQVYPNVPESLPCPVLETSPPHNHYESSDFANTGVKPRRSSRRLLPKSEKNTYSAATSSSMNDSLEGSSGSLQSVEDIQINRKQKLKNKLSTKEFNNLPKEEQRRRKLELNKICRKECDLRKKLSKEMNEKKIQFLENQNRTLMEEVNVDSTKIEILRLAIDQLKYQS